MTLEITDEIKAQLRRRVPEYVRGLLSIHCEDYSGLFHDPLDDLEDELVSSCNPVSEPDCDVDEEAWSDWFDDQMELRAALIDELTAVLDSIK